jgi:transcriptional regulator with XRE-family HTH domain
MVIGDRHCAVCKHKKLSQEDIQSRSGLLRYYISRVENGHTVPSLETLEKMARALEVPLYQLFYDGENPTKALTLPEQESAIGTKWGRPGKDARALSNMRNLLARMDGGHMKFLIALARKMVVQQNRRKVA